MLTVGSKTIKGKIMAREQAKDVYDRAIAKGDAVALLQEDAKNDEIYEINVGNIIAGTTTSVEIVLI